MRKRNKTSFDSERSRKANEKRWAKARSQTGGPDGTPDAINKESLGESEFGNIEGLPKERLIALLSDPKTPGYVTVRAAEALTRLLQSEPAKEASDWRRSPQVRPDYEPPTSAAVMEVGVQAGAITAEEAVEIFARYGYLDHLRKAVEEFKP